MVSLTHGKKSQIGLERAEEARVRNDPNYFPACEQLA